MATSNRLKGSVVLNDTAYWSAGALTAGDDMRVYEGTDNFDSGTDLSATNFATFIFDVGYGDLSTKIGATTPLKITTNGASRSTKFLGQFASVTFGGGTLTELIWNPLNSSARMSLAGATITTGYLEAGSVTMTDTTTCATLKIGGGDHLIQHHASDVPNIVVGGDARVKLERDWGTLKVTGRAKVTVELRTTVTGGTIEIDGDPEQCQVIIIGADYGNVTLDSGVLDLSQAKRLSAGGVVSHRKGSTIRKKLNGGALATYTDTPLGAGGKTVQV